MRITTRFLIVFELCFLLGIALASASIFDPDPHHPWEKLHRAFYTRTLPDGSTYEQAGGGGVDPPFLRNSRYPLYFPAYDQVNSALDDFLKNNSDRLIADPLKRAILQRDLWAVFNTVCEPKWSQQPTILLQKLAEAMRRLALTPEQIAALPDTYAALVKAESFPKAYDPQHPERPFLPPDLLDKDGPWVILGNRHRPDGLMAPSHAEFTGGRNHFLILLRLPGGAGGGRQATADYLTSLATNGFSVETSQFPTGTQVALLRYTLLIDQTGKLQPTSLVENLQMRVYQSLAKPDMYEFVLDRADLFAGKNGGLHAVGLGETSYFGFLGLDAGVEGNFSRDPLESSPQSPAPVILKSCIRCHGGPGVWGIQSFFVDHSDIPPAIASDAPTQLRKTLDATQKAKRWTLLQSLWNPQPSTQPSTRDGPTTNQRQ